MQVDRIKPTLKAPGYERLKPKYDGTCFKFCFQFQLAPLHPGGGDGRGGGVSREQLVELKAFISSAPEVKAGAYTRTRSRFSST